MITVASGSVLMTQQLWHQRALTLTFMENCILHPFCILHTLICTHPSVSETLLYSTFLHYATLRHTSTHSLLIWLFLHTQRGRKETSFTLTKMPDYVGLFLNCRQATIQSVHYQLFSCRRGKWGSTWHAARELDFRDGGLKYLQYGVLTVTFSFDLHHTLHESNTIVRWLQNTTMAGTMEK